MARISIGGGLGGLLPSLEVKGKRVGKKLKKAMPAFTAQTQASLAGLKEILGAQQQPQQQPNIVHNICGGSGGGGCHPCGASPSFGSPQGFQGHHGGGCGGNLGGSFSASFRAFAG